MKTTVCEHCGQELDEEIPWDEVAFTCEHGRQVSWNIGCEDCDMRDALKPGMAAYRPPPPCTSPAWTRLDLLFAAMIGLAAAIAVLCKMNAP